MRREVAEVSGAPPGQPAPRDARVKVIILPLKKDAQAPGAAPLELKSDPGKR